MDKISNKATLLVIISLICLNNNVYANGSILLSLEERKNEGEETENLLDKTLATTLDPTPTTDGDYTSSPDKKKGTFAERKNAEQEAKLVSLRAKAQDYLKLIEVEKADCNLSVLELFGLDSDIEQPLIASTLEKKYCRRNEITCCSNKHIEGTREKYIDGARAMKERIERIEELFVMFKGPAFGQILYEIRKNTQCDHVFEKLNLVKETFISHQELEDKTDTLGSLLVDLEIYLKRQQWFYGNMICTLCNPLNHKYFDLKENGPSTITTHISNCGEILEIKDFEIRVSEIFYQFINPMVNIVKCLNEVDDDEDENEPADEAKPVKSVKSNKSIKTDEDNDQNTPQAETEKQPSSGDNDKTITSGGDNLILADRRILADGDDDGDGLANDGGVYQDGQGSNAHVRGSIIENDYNQANQSQGTENNSQPLGQPNDVDIANPQALLIESNQNQALKDKNDANEQHNAVSRSNPQLQGNGWDQNIITDKSTANQNNIQPSETKLNLQKIVENQVTTNSIEQPQVKNTNDQIKPKEDGKKDNIQQEDPDKDETKTKTQKDQGEDSTSSGETNPEKVTKESKSSKDFELIPNIDMTPINELKTTLLKCHREKFNVQSLKCIEICSKSLINFTFPTEFFDKVSVAIEIIFEKLTENSIQDYYTKVKLREFTRTGNEGPIAFYDFNDTLVEKFKFKEVKWNYSPTDGITVFSDHMSKKYINSSVYVIAVGVFAVLGKILF